MIKIKNIDVLLKIGSSRRLERQAIHARRQPKRRRIRRVVIRHSLPEIPRKVPQRSMAVGGGQTQSVQHHSRARPGRGLDERAHDSQDLGPLHDHKGERPHQAARA